VLLYYPYNTVGDDTVSILLISMLVKIMALEVHLCCGLTLVDS